jgi:hypothetical protein
MKKMILFAFCLIMTMAGAVSAQQNPEQDIKDIKQVIQSAYVDGIQNNGEIEAIEKGFHPGFEMLIKQDNLLNKLAIYNWLQSIKRRKADPASADRPEITCKFLNIDVTGDAAVVKLELHREGELLFTDYISLYRFDNGWKIVSKLFHRHY